MTKRRIVFIDPQNNIPFTTPEFIDNHSEALPSGGPIPVPTKAWVNIIEAFKPVQDMDGFTAANDEACKVTGFGEQVRAFYNLADIPADEYIFVGGVPGTQDVLRGLLQRWTQSRAQAGVFLSNQELASSLAGLIGGSIGRHIEVVVGREQGYREESLLSVCLGSEITRQEVNMLATRFNISKERAVSTMEILKDKGGNCVDCLDAPFALAILKTIIPFDVAGTAIEQEGVLFQAAQKQGFINVLLTYPEQHDELQPEILRVPLRGRRPGDARAVIVKAYHEMMECEAESRLDRRDMFIEALEQKLGCGITVHEAEMELKINQ